jgi:hypothetical protein
MLDGEFFGDSERRAHRYKINVPAVLDRKGSDPLNVQMMNVGETGCRLKLPERLSVGTHVMLSIGGLPRLEARVRWSHENAAGLAFADPLPPGILDKLLDC